MRRSMTFSDGIQETIDIMMMPGMQLFQELVSASDKSITTPTPKSATIN